MPCLHFWWLIVISDDCYFWWMIYISDDWLIFLMTVISDNWLVFLMTVISDDWFIFLMTVCISEDCFKFLMPISHLWCLANFADELRLFKVWSLVHVPVDWLTYFVYISRPLAVLFLMAKNLVIVSLSSIACEYTPHVITCTNQLFQCIRSSMNFVFVNPICAVWLGSCYCVWQTRYRIKRSKDQ